MPKLDIYKYWQYAVDELVEDGSNGILTDGCIADFSNHGLILHDARHRGPTRIQSPRKWLEGVAKKCTIPLTLDGKMQALIDFNGKFAAVEVFVTKSGREVWAQKKFTEYFRRVYGNKCEFYVTRKNFRFNACIAVVHAGVTVGLIAALGV